MSRAAQWVHPLTELRTSAMVKPCPSCPSFLNGVDVAFPNDVSELASHGERRAEGRADRRKTSRSGRRSSDPHGHGRRVTWLFASYGIYMSVRWLPATIKRLFTRQTSLPT
jgi:hypothetical protein